MAHETAVIFNPSAGGGKARRKKRKVELSLRENGVYYDLFETESEAHMVETAKTVVQKYPMVIGAGGDTTMNIIATQVLRLQTNTKLGIISLGSVNDLARELGVHKLDSAVNAIRNKHTAAIDVGVISSQQQNEDYYFLVSASLGLGVSVNRYVDIWMRNHPVFSSFRSATQQTAAMSAIRQAFKNNDVPLELMLESEGQSHTIVSALLSFCNTSSFGGIFRPSPYASPVSGKLDCCVFDVSSFSEVFKVSIDIKRQKHIEKNKVQVLRNHTFKLSSRKPLEFQMDGEIIKLEGDVQVSVMPKALTMFVNPDVI